MKVTCIQMDTVLGKPEENFSRAEALIAREKDADVLILPETWNTGYFPQENLAACCDRDGEQVKARIGGLAKKYRVNIVAGSVSNIREGRIYNTAMVFDRTGAMVASYDKTHLFTLAGEDDYYTPGDHLCAFTLDGVRCGLIICYDLRFPELSRAMALAGLDMLFVPAQWPMKRAAHLRSLTVARAIENQIFLACCNACGNSAIIDPWGNTLAMSGEEPACITAQCELAEIQNVRNTIPVFRDRRPELYKQ